MSVVGKQQGVERCLVKEVRKVSRLWFCLFTDSLPARIVKIIKAMADAMLDACHAMCDPSPITLQTVLDGSYRRH
jgi:hypothetical protein